MRFKSINFICGGCGGSLRYSPIKQMLQCDFCGNIESIENRDNILEKFSLEDGLNVAKDKIIDSRELSCNKCGANFKLSSYTLSSNCPYCNTPTITKFTREIKSDSIIPFSIIEKEAQKRFKKWIGSLWFAPNRLKDFVDGNRKLDGYYLPYWLFDANTYTRYSGQRGDIYFVTVQKRVIINGKEQIIQEQEPRIRWTPVRGEVSNSFKDLTISASKRLPYKLLESLSPWRIDLKPFNKKYLSGFISEEYSIELKSGFNLAKKKMERVIRQDIRADIGGDQQQIEFMKSQYSNLKYRDTLFPLYSAEFKWKGKTYNYLINGQSGKVVGERPYSIVKISILVVSILIIMGIIFIIYNKHY